MKTKCSNDWRRFSLQAYKLLFFFSFDQLRLNFVKSEGKREREGIGMNLLMVEMRPQITNKRK